MLQNIMIRGSGSARNFCGAHVFFRMLVRIDAGQTIVSNHLQPVFRALVAAILLRERITPSILGGGSLGVPGTVLATIEDARHRMARSVTERAVSLT